MQASELGPGLGMREGEGSTPAAPGPAQDLRVLSPWAFPEHGLQAGLPWAPGVSEPPMWRGRGVTG